MEGNPRSDDNLIPSDQSFAYQQGSQFQNVLPFRFENTKEIEKPSDDNWKIFDEGDGADDGCYEDKGEFLWHRVKWTAQMVKFLINSVCYVEEDASRKSSMSHKIGKWKCVSTVMVERGYRVSPQQCEDKFNDLNKRYKRLNEVLGKGTSCKVVENPELLAMMNVSSKVKEDVKKILSSKNLFYEEMCSYHNRNRMHLPHDDEPNQSRKRNRDDDCEKEQQDAEPDDQFSKGTSRFPELSSKRSKQMNGMKDVMVGNPLNKMAYVKKLGADKQDDQLDSNHVYPDNSSANGLREQWMAFRLLELKRQKLQIQAQKLELEKQLFKWRRINWNEDSDLDKMRLENECMKLANELLAFKIRTRK